MQSFFGGVGLVWGHYWESKLFCEALLSIWDSFVGLFWMGRALMQCFFRGRHVFCKDLSEQTLLENYCVSLLRGSSLYVWQRAWKLTHTQTHKHICTHTQRHTQIDLYTYRKNISIWEARGWDFSLWQICRALLWGQRTPWWIDRALLRIYRVLSWNTGLFCGALPKRKGSCWEKKGGVCTLCIQSPPIPLDVWIYDATER